MKFSLKTFSIFVIICSIFGMAGNADAFPAKDLMEKFPLKERRAYVTALVHMASYQATINKEEERSKCMVDWYHETDHVKAFTYIEKALQKFPDWQGVEVVMVVLNQKCGKPANWPE